MKGNKKLLIIAVLLLLITVSFTTYAIYKTSVATNAEVTAATWNVAFKNGENTITESQNITFTTTECASAHVTPGKIAPGASCTKKIKLATSGTEVDVAYTVDVDTANITATKENVAVETSDANAFTATLTPASGTITYDKTGTDTALTLTVSWAGTEEETTTDPADTALNGATITVPVTLVAKQVVG